MVDGLYAQQISCNRIPITYLAVGEFERKYKEHMKTHIDYLPPHKQTELSTLVSMVTDIMPAEMIILFGSYARGDWVEDKYDETHYRYQSDFDLLVIVETKSETAQGKFEGKIEEAITQNELAVLVKRVEKLRETGQLICTEIINHFVS